MLMPVTAAIVFVYYSHARGQLLIGWRNSQPTGQLHGLQQLGFAEEMLRKITR